MKKIILKRIISIFLLLILLISIASCESNEDEEKQQKLDTVATRITNKLKTNEYQYINKDDFLLVKNEPELKQRLLTAIKEFSPTNYLYDSKLYSFINTLDYLGYYDADIKAEIKKHMSCYFEEAKSSDALTLFKAVYDVKVDYSDSYYVSLEDYCSNDEFLTLFEESFVEEAIFENGKGGYYDDKYEDSAEEQWYDYIRGDDLLEMSPDFDWDEDVYSFGDFYLNFWSKELPNEYNSTYGNKDGFYFYYKGDKMGDVYKPAAEILTEWIQNNRISKVYIIDTEKTDNQFVFISDNEEYLIITLYGMDTALKF